MSDQPITEMRIAELQKDVGRSRGVQKQLLGLHLRLMGWYLIRDLKIEFLTRKLNQLLSRRR